MDWFLKADPKTIGQSGRSVDLRMDYDRKQQWQQAVLETVNSVAQTGTSDSWKPVGSVTIFERQLPLRIKTTTRWLKPGCSGKRSMKF